MLDKCGVSGRERGGWRCWVLKEVWGIFLAEEEPGEMAAAMVEFYNKRV